MDGGHGHASQVALLLSLALFATTTTPRVIAGVTTYADVELKYVRGEVIIQKIKPGRFAKPTALPRYRGRFTAIIAKGKQNLVELEFDFPLVARAESEDMSEEARQLGKKLRDGVTSQTTVRVPWPDGAERLIVYDAVTGARVTAPLAPAP